MREESFSMQDARSRLATRRKKREAEKQAKNRLWSMRIEKTSPFVSNGRSCQAVHLTIFTIMFVPSRLRPLNSKSIIGIMQITPTVREK